MTALSSAGARVLLIATAEHDGSILPDVPSVANSVIDLRTVLTERCGVAESRLKVLINPLDPEAMARAIAEEAQRAETVLMVYFIGHGLLGPDGKELYLAAKGTNRLTPGLAGYQALSFSALRQAAMASRAPSVVVVLDCCYSGRASFGANAPLPGFAMEPTHGLYLVASAEQLALAPATASHTAFTGEVIRLLTHGDPRGPQRLTLDSIYDAVFQAMRDRQGPLPRRQAADRSGSLLIAPNPAAAPQHVDAEVPESPASGRSPYPGLAAFGADDAEVFFGRDAMTDRLATAASTGNLVILVGPSGSGKSSLLNAGLLARVRDGCLPNSAGWPCVRLTPGDSPLRRLATQLGGEPDAVDRLRVEPAHAVELVRRLLTGTSDRRLLLLADQLEELFVLCPDATERTNFLTALQAIADEGLALVVFALRADFYAQAAQLPELVEVLRTRQVLVEPMDRAELRASIEGPAQAAGLTLDGGLADVILHELGPTASDALPLLSHAMWETWRHRSGARLTVAGYRAAGGISQAITTSAEQVYRSLGPAGRDATRRMLPRLIHIGYDNVADTARPVDRTLLLQVVPDVHAAQEVITKFVEARLLTVDHDTVRISHEALLQEWPRLKTWIDADRDWLSARQQVAADVDSWGQSNHDASLLYRGNKLAAMRERMHQAPVAAAGLEPALNEFLVASSRHESRAARQRRIAVASLVVLTLLATTGLVASLIFQRQATHAQERDLARYLAAEANGLRDRQPGVAKQLSLLAYQIDKDAGQGALLSSLRTPGVIGPNEPAHDLVHSADGRVLAIGVGDAIVLRGLNDDRTGRITGVDPGPIAVTPEADLIATAAYNGNASESAKIRLWGISNLTKPELISTLEQSSNITALAISGDGGTLFAGRSNGEVQRWDVSDPATPELLPSLAGHGTRVDSLAVSSERHLLASMSIDGQVYVWDLLKVVDGAPAQIADFQGAHYETAWEEKPAHRVAFSSDGRFFAHPANREYIPQLWDLRDPREPKAMDLESGHAVIEAECSSESGIASLAFDPDDDRFVYSCGYRWYIMVYTIDPASMRPGASIKNRNIHDSYGPVLFDPSDRRRLLHATGHGVDIWDVANSWQSGVKSFLPSPTLVGRLDPSITVARRGQRNLLATLVSDHNSLYDITDLSSPKELSVTPAPPSTWSSGVALSPDGGLYAFVELLNPQGASSALRLQLRSTTEPDAPLGRVGSGILHSVSEMTFSPDGRLLVVGDGGDPQANVPPRIRIFDITDRKRPRQITRIASSGAALAFSPDGKTLVARDVVAGADPFGSGVGRRLRSWDLSDPVNPTELWSHDLPARGVFANFAFRPDGALFAEYLDTGMLRLWRVQRHRLVGPPVVVQVTGLDGFSSPVAFSPDGKRLALLVSHLGLESRPEVWDLTNPDTPVRQGFLPEGSISGVESTLAFTPDGSALAVLRDGTGVDLWDTNPERIAASLCLTIGDPLTPQQWDRYLPGRPYQPPCR